MQQVDRPTADSTSGFQHSSGVEIAERLARIGGVLETQRVDLLSVDGETATLEAFWTASGVESAPTEQELGPIPLTWYPWSLGNVRTSEYIFVRQAEALPIAPDSDLRLGHVGLISALHIPIAMRDRTRGAVSAYWVEEQADFDDATCGKVWEWALDALDWAFQPH